MFITLKMGIISPGDISEAARGMSHDASFLGHRWIYERKYLVSSFPLLEIGMVSPEFPDVVKTEKMLVFNALCEF